MAWINLCATRHTLRQVVKECLENPEDFEIDSMASYTGLLALMVGDRLLFDRVAELARPTYEQYSELMREDPEHLFSVQRLSDLFTLSVIEHVSGQPQDDLWRWIAGLPRFSDREMRSLRSCVEWLIEPPKMRKKAFSGHIETDIEWSKALSKRPLDHLLDLALSYDHPRWIVLARYVPALALTVASQRAVAGEDVDPMDLFSQGSRPRKHSRVLYERVAERPDPMGEVNPEDPATWFGFDAVEILENELVAYHFLGHRWQAPLLYADDLNAFHFLDRLDLSWKQVEEQVALEDWQEILALRTSDRSRHVVVYDSSVAEAYEDDLERASAAYGLRLEAADVTEV